MIFKDHLLEKIALSKYFKFSKGFESSYLPFTDNESRIAPPIFVEVHWHKCIREDSNPSISAAQLLNNSDLSHQHIYFSRYIQPSTQQIPPAHESNHQFFPCSRTFLESENTLVPTRFRTLVFPFATPSLLLLLKIRSFGKEASTRFAFFFS